MKNSLRFILLSASLVFLFPKRTAKACGFWVEPGEYRFWLMQPDLTNEPDLTPFYFATTYLYKNDITAAQESYVEQNIHEWFAEVKGKASKTDIDFLLNHMDPQHFFDEEKSLATKNTLLQFVLQPQHRELYQYLQLSKKVEQIANDPDPWDEDVHPRTPILKVIDEAREIYSSSKSSFVKLRTAYQLMRLYGYQSQDDQLNKTYDSFIAPVNSNSWIKTAALYQKAINAQGTEYNYLLSKVFDKGGYNRTHCIVRFQFEEFDATLKLAKNQHERNVMFAMKLFNNPGRTLEEIKRLYRLEPSYKEIPFLLLREINKVEDWLLTNKVTEFESPAVYGQNYWEDYPEYSEKNYRNDMLYARQLYDFLQQIISEGNQKSTALLHLYAAHLSLLDNDYNRSRKHLMLAKSEKKLPPNVQTQIRVNWFLLDLENGMNKQTEDQFMWIMKSPDEKLGVYDPDIMKSQLVLYTAQKMIKQGDKARGLLLLGKTNRAFGDLPIGDYKDVYQEIEEQADEEVYSKLFTVLDKKNKSSFESFISGKDIKTPYDRWVDDSDRLQWDYNRLLDCKASWYIREHRLNDAYVVLQQIPDSFYEQDPYDYYIGGDPFYLDVHNAHPISKEEKRDLNKKEVIREMLRLEQLAKTDRSKSAECYYQLGNAWYNMTYYGKNWLMVKQWWSVNEPYFDDAQKVVNSNKDYYGCLQAKKYYEKAFSGTKDRKLAALCFYLAEICNENYKNYMEDTDIQYAAHGSTITSSNARKRGIDLKYYNDIVKECETYQSYIRQYNKVF